jgi:hypothetical protein
MERWIWSVPDGLMPNIVSAREKAVSNNTVYGIPEMTDVIPIGQISSP